MIRQEDLVKIGEDMKAAGFDNVRTRDVAYNILSAAIADRTIAARIAMNGENVDIDQYCALPMHKKLRQLLKDYGIDTIRIKQARDVDEITITKEENRAELLKMLDDIDRLMNERRLSTQVGLTLKKDIRIKLQDKFDIEEGNGVQRIIVVPQKRDYICPHTNKECTKMPSKEACIEYYKLNVKEQKKEIENEQANERGDS